MLIAYYYDLYVQDSQLVIIKRTYGLPNIEIVWLSAKQSSYTLYDVSDLHLLILFYSSRILLGFHVTFKFYNFQICFRSNALRTPWDHSTIIFVSSRKFCLVWPCILGDFKILPNGQGLYLILMSSLPPNCLCYLCPDSSSHFVQFWPSFSVSKSIYSITSCYFFWHCL